MIGSLKNASAEVPPRKGVPVNEQIEVLESALKEIIAKSSGEVYEIASKALDTLRLMQSEQALREGRHPV